VADAFCVGLVWVVAVFAAVPSLFGGGTTALTGELAGRNPIGATVELGVVPFGITGTKGTVGAAATLAIVRAGWFSEPSTLKAGSNSNGAESVCSAATLFRAGSAVGVALRTATA
jgi:hypothetical protein